MRHEHGDALEVTADPARPFRASDRDICDSYLYLLGRLLVLRQEHFDVLAGAQWNQLVHRDVAASREHSQLEVAISEAWVAVDEASCTLIDVPAISGRYFTVQVVNLWGETIANINERALPGHSSGTFALCLKGARLALPRDAYRIDLTGRKARVLIKIELGANPAEAVALQHQIALRATGRPLVQATVGIPLFTNEKLPGVEAFDTASAVLQSEQDINPGMEQMQAKVRAIAAIARDHAERVRIDRVIRERSWGLRQGLYVTQRDWTSPKVAGSYGDDWMGRTAANLFAIWSNTKTEVVSFRAGTITPYNGDHVYTMTFERDELPPSRVKYFWTLACLSSSTQHVMANSRDRFLLSSRSPLQLDRDGKLTLYFAPKLPAGAPDENWLPTPQGRSYVLTWRSYGPDQATVTGAWFPPALQRISASG